MTEVPVSMELLTYAVTSGVKLENRFTAEELKKLGDYYGNQPQLLEGFEFFMNSERQEIFAKLHGTKYDLSQECPIRINCPTINVLFDTYKVRAIVDTGSTTTIISKGLLDCMPETAAKL